MSKKITEARQKLLAKLKRGDRKRIADTLGMTNVGLFYILRGDWENDEVWKLVKTIAEERDANDAALIKAAENLSC